MLQHGMFDIAPQKIFSDFVQGLLRLRNPSRESILAQNVLPPNLAKCGAMSEGVDSAWFVLRPCGFFSSRLIY